MRTPENPTGRTRPVWCVIALALACSAASAADVDKRFRLALLLGGGVPTDEIRSNSANVLTILDDAGEIEDRFKDPRDSAAITGVLESQPAGLTAFSLQYAVSPLLIVEARVGYENHNVGEIEVQEVLRFRQLVRVPAGELTQMPIRLNALVRFRPHASFNPYIGGGLGYTVVDFEKSPELEQLSANLKLSEGRPTILLSENRFDHILVTQDPLRRLGGAEVETGSAFEWQIAGGAEFSFGDHWSTFVDMSHVFSRARVRIGFDGTEDVGVGVPQATTVVDSALTTVPYGPFQILQGGALDFTGDGVPDSGYYYIEGGRLRLDGFTFQVGMRYTF